MATTRSQGILVECTVCMARDMIALPEMGRDALRVHQDLFRHCKYCLQETLWQIASHTRGVDSGLTHDTPSTGNAPIPCETNSPKMERREKRRCKMKMTGCIRDGDLEDVITVLDASRNGIRFQSSRQYASMWVQIAVPYTAGTSNIFMSGRIVWRKRITESLHEYGLRYNH